MTALTRKVLIGVAAGAFVTSTILFIAEWSGSGLPRWGYDMRWILLFIASAVSIIAVISRHIIANKEAFQIGIEVGERRFLNGVLSSDDAKEKLPRSRKGNHGRAR